MKTTKKILWNLEKWRKVREAVKKYFNKWIKWAREKKNNKQKIVVSVYLYACVLKLLSYELGLVLINKNSNRCSSSTMLRLLLSKVPRTLFIYLILAFHCLLDLNEMSITYLTFVILCKRREYNLQHRSNE